MSEITNLDNLDDIDSLLDKNLDDIADLPEFKTFVPGAHKCKLTWERKDIEKTVNGSKQKVPHMQANFEYIEVIEHADAKDNDSPAKAGDKCNTAYDLTNEFALGALKKATKTLGEHLGTGNLKEIIKGSNGFEVALICKNRADKNDKDRKYLQVEDIIPC